MDKFQHNVGEIVDASQSQALNFGHVASLG